ncbi:hypothetical protein B566_EDAN017595 [Ephemera danica]|nr:hypothetical protein B566_EDAN017595 [Ephemera danica]
MFLLISLINYIKSVSIMSLFNLVFRFVSVNSAKQCNLKKSLLPWCQCSVSKQYSTAVVNENSQNSINLPVYLDLKDEFDSSLKSSIIKDMTVIHDFLSSEEEQSILNEIEPYLKRLRYEFDHWDDAIHGYRETERLKWNSENSKIIQRVRELAFPVGCAQLRHVHVLDLDAKGVIKPHVDSTRFCGNTIAGLSLLSDCVMRLVHSHNSEQVVDIYLKQRSLYIMRDSARYDYTHEVLGAEHSFFKENAVPRSRRISIICRNEPTKNTPTCT